MMGMERRGTLPPRWAISPQAHQTQARRLNALRITAIYRRQQRRNDRVLTIVAERQYVDWRSFRFADASAPAFRQEIGRFCEKIAETLHETWVSPEERRQLESEARKCPEEEERERLRREALAMQRAPLMAAQERALKPTTPSRRAPIVRK